MKRIALVLAATALVGACAQNPPPPVVPPVDVTSPLYGPTFLQTATSANLLEIQSSQLALQMSQNPSVRSFAQMIIADHQQLGAQMAAAAQSAGVPPPPPALSPDDQARLSALQAAGPGFDMAYRDMQVAAHQQAIGLFQNYATSGDNPVLRGTASQALPALQRHLAAAQAIVLTPPPPPPPPLPPRPGERG